MADVYYDDPKVDDWENTPDNPFTRASRGGTNKLAYRIIPYREMSVALAQCVEELAKQQHTDEQIAKKFGFPVKRVSKARRDLGIPKVPKPRKRQCSNRWTIHDHSCFLNNRAAGPRWIWEMCGYKELGYSLRAISTECKILWAEDDRLGPTVEELYNLDRPYNRIENARLHYEQLQGESSCSEFEEPPDPSYCAASSSAERSESVSGTCAPAAPTPDPTISTSSPTATIPPIPESSMRAVAVGNIFSWNDVAKHGTTV